MENLVENIWVSEIRTPKIWVIENCENTLILGFRNSDTQNVGNSKLRKNIWVSEIRTPKIPGHRKSRQNIWVSEFWHGSITRNIYFVQNKVTQHHKPKQVILNLV